LAPGSIAGELLLNGIPQWLIDDRRVFAGMELVLVNDLAAIGAVLQHQVERARENGFPPTSRPEALVHEPGSSCGDPATRPSMSASWSLTARERMSRGSF
jgi:hypothetical protein